MPERSWAQTLGVILRRSKTSNLRRQIARLNRGVRAQLFLFSAPNSPSAGVDRPMGQIHRCGGAALAWARAPDILERSDQAKRLTVWPKMLVVRAALPKIIWMNIRCEVNSRKQRNPFAQCSSAGRNDILLAIHPLPGQFFIPRTQRLDHFRR